MNHLEIYGPYKSKRAPWWRLAMSMFGYVLTAALALGVAWIALLWVLDLYLSFGMPEYPAIPGTQYH